MHRAGQEGASGYLDLGNDGIYLNGDPYAVTDANGNCTFAGLPAGTYIVRLIHVPGSTRPEGITDWTTTLVAGATQLGGSFGEV